jgi:hypothetical protein
MSIDPSLCTYMVERLHERIPKMLDRRAIRNCLREHDPELHTFFLSSVRTRDPDVNGTGTEDGTVGMVALSCQGVSDARRRPLSSHIRHRVNLPRPQAACKRCTDAHFVAIHDDTYFAAPLNKLIEINDFLTECAAAVGLQYVPKKECVFQLPDSTRPASADLTSLRSSIADITKFVRSYFRCGGIAVGDPAAVDDYARRAACEYRTHVEHLARSQLQIQLKTCCL